MTRLPLATLGALLVPVALGGMVWQAGTVENVLSHGAPLAGGFDRGLALIAMSLSLLGVAMLLMTRRGLEQARMPKAGVLAGSLWILASGLMVFAFGASMRLGARGLDTWHGRLGWSRIESLHLYPKLVHPLFGPARLALVLYITDKDGNGHRFDDLGSSDCWLELRGLQQLLRTHMDRLVVDAHPVDQQYLRTHPDTRTARLYQELIP